MGAPLGAEELDRFVREVIPPRRTHTRARARTHTRTCTTQPRTHTRAHRHIPHTHAHTAYARTQTGAQTRRLQVSDTVMQARAAVRTRAGGRRHALPYMRTHTRTQVRCAVLGRTIHGSCDAHSNATIGALLSQHTQRAPKHPRARGCGGQSGALLPTAELARKVCDVRGPWLHRPLPCGPLHRRGICVALSTLCCNSVRCVATCVPSDG